MRPLSRLVYDRKGSGEPVVLIHGIGHHRHAWAPVFDRLAQKYDVVALDLAGFGDSPAYPDGVHYDMGNAVADLVANFAEWGLDRPHVVGNSLGGAIALELAARGHASSATVLSPAGFFRTPEIAQPLLLLGTLKVVSTVLPAPALRAVSKSPVGRQVVGSLLFAHPERLAAEDLYADALAMKQCTAFWRTIKAGIGYHFTGPVDVPATVAWGTEDRILPYRQARRARAVLPGADHVPLPGCGHVPMVDNPALITALIDVTVARALEARAA